MTMRVPAVAALMLATASAAISGAHNSYGVGSENSSALS